MEAKPVYRPRDPQFLAKDLALSVYVAAMSAKQRDLAQTIEILEVAREALQRIRSSEEPEQEVLPHAADLEPPQPWKRSKARKRTRWDDEDDDAPYDM